MPEDYWAGQGVPCAQCQISGHIYAGVRFWDRRQAPPLIASGAGGCERELGAINGGARHLRQRRHGPDVSAPEVSGTCFIRATMLATAAVLHRGWGKCLTPIPRSRARPPRKNGRPLRGGHLDA